VATEDDKIYHVVNTVFGIDSDAPAPTFTRRMDVLFGRDCRDTNGRLHHIRRGPLGMALFVNYLRGIDWSTAAIPFVTASLKLLEIMKEMETLWCAIILQLDYALIYSTVTAPNPLRHL
jgi:hypothetical protein